MTTPTRSNKDLQEELIFYKKLISYHEQTIEAQRERISQLEAQSKQMQILLASSAEKLQELEAEKDTRPRSPLMNMLPSSLARK